MKKFKWFWPWQDKEEETWLHAMALTGWQLSAISLPGIYAFEKIEPAHIFYRLDYHNKQKMGLNKYLDSRFVEGWEFITRMNGWLYFCKNIPEDQAYQNAGDIQAKTDKLQHQMTTMVSFLSILVLWFPLFGTRLKSPFYEIGEGVYIFLLVVFAIGMIKIYRRFSQLRRL